MGETFGKQFSVHLAKILFILREGYKEKNLYIPRLHRDILPYCPSSQSAQYTEQVCVEKTIFFCEEYLWIVGTKCRTIVELQERNLPGG